MTDNDQIDTIETDSVIDLNGSIATIRQFQKPPFTTGVIVSEQVARLRGRTAQAHCGISQPAIQKSMSNNLVLFMHRQ